MIVIVFLFCFLSFLLCFLVLLALPDLIQDLYRGFYLVCGGKRGRDLIIITLKEWRKNVLTCREWRNKTQKLRIKSIWVETTFLKLSVCSTASAKFVTVVLLLLNESSKVFSRLPGFCFLHCILVLMNSSISSIILFPSASNYHFNFFRNSQSKYQYVFISYKSVHFISGGTRRMRIDFSDVTLQFAWEYMTLCVCVCVCICTCIAEPSLVSHVVCGVYQEGVRRVGLQVTTDEVSRPVCSGGRVLTCMNTCTGYVDYRHSPRCSYTL